MSIVSDPKDWIAAVWVLGSIGFLLGHSVLRMSTFFAETIMTDLSTVQQAAFVASVVGFGVVEGYVGFHRSFAPRFARRFRLLLVSANNRLLLVGPLFCLGLVPFGRRYRADWLRFLVTTAAIVVMVMAVREVPSPWRGIIVSGVAVALFLGMLTTIIQSLLVFAAHIRRRKDLPSGR